jgi:hypothetical protein
MCAAQLKTSLEFFEVYPLDVNFTHNLQIV